MAHLGAEVKANWENRSTGITVGGDYRYDEKTLLKGKLNSDGKLAGALVRNLNRDMKFTIAAEVDANRMTNSTINDFRLGFRLDFNHNES